MDNNITVEDVERFTQNKVWKDFIECVRSRIEDNMKATVHEYKIDKIREHQGGTKELLWVLAYPRLLIEDIKEEEAVKQELDKLNIESIREGATNEQD